MRKALLYLLLIVAAVLAAADLSATGAVPGNVTLVVPSTAPPSPGPGGGGGWGGGFVLPMNITPALPPGAAFIVTAPAPMPDRATIEGYNLSSGYWCADLSSSSQLTFYRVCLYTTGQWPYWEIIIQNVTRPEFLPTIENHLPDQLAYQYMNVTIIGNPPEELFRNITFNFKVDKVWLNSNFVSPASIKLSRYHNGWEDLPTFLLGQDEKYVLFDAHFSPGFSYFVIHGTPRPLLPMPAFVVERMDLFLLLLLLLIILLMYLLALIRRTKLDIRRMERIKALQRIKRWKRRK